MPKNDDTARPSVDAHGTWTFTGDSDVATAWPRSGSDPDGTTWVPWMHMRFTRER